MVDYEKIIHVQRSGYLKYISLFVLFLIFCHNIVSRYLLVFLYAGSVDDDMTPEEKKRYSMKEDLDLSNAQLGILTGPAFSLVFACIGTFSGWAADNLNRKYVMMAALSVWTLATVSWAFATQFWQVLIARLIQSGAQACGPPLAYSMIADYFLKEHRGFATGLYASAVYVGYGTASLSLVLNGEVGWKNTVFISGIVGAVVLILHILVTREPVRERMIALQKPSSSITPLLSDDSLVLAETHEETESTPLSPLPQPEKTSLLTSMKDVIRPTSVKILIVAAAIRLGGGIVFGAFFPQFMRQQFPDQKKEFAVLNAIAVSVAGTLSSFIGGRISDSWNKISTRKLHREVMAATVVVRAEQGINTLGVNSDVGDITINGADDDDIDPRLSHISDLSSYALFSTFCCLASVLFFGVIFINNLYGAMAMLFITYLFTESWFAPMLCVISQFTAIPAASRGTAIALTLSWTNIIAAGFPIVAGIVEDKYHNLRAEMVAFVILPNIIGGILFGVVFFLQKKYARQSAMEAINGPLSL